MYGEFLFCISGGRHTSGIDSETAERMYIETKQRSFSPEDVGQIYRNNFTELHEKETMKKLYDQLLEFADNQSIVPYINDARLLLENPESLDEHRKEQVYMNLTSLALALMGITANLSLSVKPYKTYTVKPIDNICKAIISIIKSVRTDGWLLEVPITEWIAEARKEIQSNI